MTSEPEKIDEPILNNVESTVNKDTTVTVAMLDQYMASMLADLEKNQNAQFQSLMLGMDKRLGEQIEPMIKRLNELTTFVNNVQQATQAKQEIQGDGQKKTNELINVISNSPLGEKLVPIILKKLGLEDDGDIGLAELSEYSKFTKALARVYLSEATKDLKTTMHELWKTKRASALAPQTRQILEDTLNHDPV